MGKRQRIKNFFKFSGGGDTSASSHPTKTPSTGTFQPEALQLYNSKICLIYQYLGNAEVSSNFEEGHGSFPHLPVNEDTTSLPSTKPHVTTNITQAVSITTPTFTTKPDALFSISHAASLVELVPGAKERQTISKSTELSRSMAMNATASHTRDIANNKFGKNTIIHQGDIHNYSPDQIDRCLADLRPTDPRHDKMRIQQIKGGLFSKSYFWIFQNENFKEWRDNEQIPLLWIKGDPGKGKTMLLCGVIDELISTTRLAKPMDRSATTILSYFFCQGTDSRINSATAVLRGLIYLIIAQQPSLISHVQEKYNHAGKTLFSDTNAWVALSEIFATIIQDPKTEKLILIIDALDECETDLPNLLNLIVQHLSLSHVKWIISSRNIASIQQKLESYIRQGILSLELKENEEFVAQAVNIYIKYSISRLHSIQDNQGLRDKLQELMQAKANGTFLWVSLIMKELEEAESWQVMQVVKEMPRDLTAVYKRMISQVRNLKQPNAELCQNILSTVFTAYRPLSLAELGILSSLPSEISTSFQSIKKLIAMCGSFLTIRGGSIYFIHQSAKDFLSSEKFQHDIFERHLDIYKRSIKAMSNLKQNIYGLTDFGFKPKNTQPPNPDPLAPLQYSCLFWIDHLCDASNPENELVDDEGVWLFLKDHVLHWLESLSLLGRLPDSVRLIRRILQELQFNMNLRLTTFLNDIERFILSNGSIIDRAPLQAYGSALVFSPGLSEVKKQQWKERLVFIKDIHGLKERDAYLQTLEGHGDAVQAIAFSPDSKTLASGSLDHTVRLWDAITGSLKQTLKGHTEGVKAIAFSPDGKTLASGSLDHTVRLWDAKTGSLKQTLECHYDEVKAIVFSPDGKTLASGSLRGTVRLWDAITGSLQQILPVYNNWVQAIAFSPDSKTLASALIKTLKLWDAKTGSLQQTLKGHKNDIKAITFSPDNKTLASGSGDKAVWLWDVTTGSHQQTLEGHIDTVKAIAFSPDGKTLASTTRETVWLWDVATGSHQQTLEGHSDWVKAITFSPDGKSLASASDKMLRLWDTTITSTQETLKEHSNEIQAIALSPDGKTLASTSYHTLDLWDTTTGLLEETIDKPGQVVEVIRFSPDGNMIATASFMTLGVWDVETGSLQLELWAQGRWVRGITFSPDSKTLASASNEAVELWDTATESLQQKIKGFSHGAEGVAFSADGKTLALVIDWKTIWLRDITTGSIQQRIEGHSERIRALAFSPDGKMLASASDDKTIRLWDTATGLLQQTLQNYGHGDQVMTFSADGKILNTGHGSMRIHDDSNIQTSTCGAKNALLITDEWITYNGKELLWLPAEYRDSFIAVYGHMVAIGLRLGGVIFLHLKL
ncbi:Pfs, NACHT and WD domain protein [Trichoderma velutinum]